MHIDKIFKNIIVELFKNGYEEESWELYKIACNTKRKITAKNKITKLGQVTNNLTIDYVKGKLRELGSVMKRPEYDEFRVNFKGAGEESAYYTDDLQDALATGESMWLRKEENPEAHAHLFKKAQTDLNPGWNEKEGVTVDYLPGDIPDEYVPGMEPESYMVEVDDSQPPEIRNKLQLQCLEILEDIKSRNHDLAKKLDRNYKFDFWVIDKTINEIFEIDPTGLNAPIRKLVIKYIKELIAMEAEAKRWRH